MSSPSTEGEPLATAEAACGFLHLLPRLPWETHRVFGQKLQKTWRTGRAVGSDFISLMEGPGAGSHKEESWVVAGDWV